MFLSSLTNGQFLVLELVQELVLEVQMAGPRTSVLELVLELVQELQMASPRTCS